MKQRWIKQVWQRLRSRFLITPALYVGVRLIKLLIKALLSTCKVEVDGIKHLIDTATHNRCMLALWHNRLVILPEILMKHSSQFIYRAVISKSKDAEILALLTNSYRSGRSLRVPHDKRFQALAEMICQLKQGGEVIVLTPDGPRGPQYKAKPGIVIAAKKSQAKIVPFSWSGDHYWELKTWDRLRIPKPFSRIKVVFGEPVGVAEGDSIEKAQLMLEKVLLDLDSRL